MATFIEHFTHVERGHVLFRQKVRVSPRACGGTLGGNVETVSGSLQLPGETSPTLQVAAVPGKQLVQTVTRDGVPWNYAYSYNGGAPYFHAPSNAYWVTRLAVTGPNGFNQVHNFSISGQRNVCGSPGSATIRAGSW